MGGQTPLRLRSALLRTGFDKLRTGLPTLPRVGGFVGLGGCLGRSERVVELLLELGDGTFGGGGPGFGLGSGAVGAAVRVGPGLIPGDFAASPVVEDLDGPDSVVAVGLGVVAPGDFAEVVEDAV